MTVKLLIEKLAKLDPEMEVVIAIDEEGNGYNPLEDVETNHMYDKVSHEISLKELTPELIKQGYTEEDLPSDDSAVDAVVLWP